MKTKIALAIALLFSSASMAHVSRDSDSCDVELEHSVKVTPAYVQVMDGDQSLYRITDDSRLIVSGKEVMLTPEQEAALEDFSEQLHQMVPEVVVLIKQAFAFAKEAIGRVFSELFGEEDDLKPRVEQVLADFEGRFAPYISGDDGEYLISKEGLELAGDEFGNEVSEEIEELIQQSTGKLMMMVGRMMIEGEGGMGEFQQRMEALGQEMEVRGEQMAQRGKAMCAKMQQVEVIESEMQKKIPQLADYDLIRI